MWPWLVDAVLRHMAQKLKCYRDNVVIQRLISFICVCDCVNHCLCPEVVEYRNVESSDLVEGHEENISDVQLGYFLLHFVSMLYGHVVLCCTSFNASTSTEVV